MRDSQAKKAANKAYRESRRAMRPVIYQRPLEIKPVRNGREINGHSTSVIPRNPQSISWKEANKRGKAYGRVLENLPKYPNEAQAKEIAAAQKADRDARERRKAGFRPKRIHSAAHAKRGGESWWNWKIADVIDERPNNARPAYRARGNRKPRRSDAATQKRNLEFFEKQ